MVLWCLGFRPFFLLAGTWAVAAVGLWLVILSGGGWPGMPNDGIAWHIHEMVFGFAGAALAGFLLTAIANFTGRPPVRGLWLAMIAASWLLGRFAMAFQGLLAPAVVALGDGLFPVLLAVTVARELLAARSNIPLGAIVVVFAGADLLYQLGRLGIGVEPAATLAAAPHLFFILIALMGGRIIPAFTANWLRARGAEALPVRRKWLERLVLPLTVAVAIGDSGWPGSTLAGLLGLAAAIVHGWRLAGWRGLASREEPLLLVLHVGYGWLVVGYALLAISALGGVPGHGAAMHALTAGAMGTMILAMMSRVPLGHTGRALHAGRPIVIAYVLVNLAAMTRVISASAGGEYYRLLTVSGLLWLAAYLIYCWVYVPILLGPRVEQTQ